MMILSLLFLKSNCRHNNERRNNNSVLIELERKNFFKVVSFKNYYCIASLFLFLLLYITSSPVVIVVHFISITDAFTVVVHQYHHIKNRLVPKMEEQQQQQYQMSSSSSNNNNNHNTMNQNTIDEECSTILPSHQHNDIGTEIIIHENDDDKIRSVVVDEIVSTHDSSNTNNYNNKNTILYYGSNGQPLQITWEQKVAQDILRNSRSNSRHRRRGPYMVAIAGIPGSGKSSSAEIITHLINQQQYSIEQQHQQQQQTQSSSLSTSIVSNDTTNTASTTRNTNNNNTHTTNICVCIPADGYHYTIKELQQLQITNNDTTLIYRRGAPDTFNVSLLLHDLERIVNVYNNTKNHNHTTTITTTDATTTTTTTENELTNHNNIITLPGFDHAIGDPIPDQHIYNPNQHEIIIIEGLYLLYNQYNWEHVLQYFHESIYIRTNTIDTCMERVKIRNVCIPGYTIDEIYQRVDIVDRQNAILIDSIAPSRATNIITTTPSESV